MIPATPKAFGKALCNALGIDIAGVKEIVVRCVVGEAATVEVTRFVKREFDVTTLGEKFVAHDLRMEEKTETLTVCEREEDSSPAQIRAALETAGFRHEVSE